MLGNSPRRSSRTLRSSSALSSTLPAMNSASSASGKDRQQEVVGHHSRRPVRLSSKAFRKKSLMTRQGERWLSPAGAGTGRPTGAVGAAGSRGSRRSRSLRLRRRCGRRPSVPRSSGRRSGARGQGGAWGWRPSARGRAWLWPGARASRRRPWRPVWGRPEARLSLRVPGRERGRLPSNPGSSAHAGGSLEPARDGRRSKGPLYRIAAKRVEEFCGLTGQSTQTAGCHG